MESRLLSPVQSLRLQRGKPLGGDSGGSFGRRKRAPLTGTAFDFIRIGIPCPQCGKENMEPLAELVVNDDVGCDYCGAVIDLRANGWPAKLRKLADEYKQIKP